MHVFISFTTSRHKSNVQFKYYWARLEILHYTNPKSTNQPLDTNLCSIDHVQPLEWELLRLMARLGINDDLRHAQLASSLCFSVWKSSINISFQYLYLLDNASYQLRDVRTRRVHRQYCACLCDFVPYMGQSGGSLSLYIKYGSLRIQRVGIWTKIR